ncbi:MAG: (d)CMP kinase [Chloroflexota bacterium]|nr:(d)CMP kinase [Dehalococcoidia bacterium]MEE3013226.1 (d)CMP kinase [Chloroflexota bacterium]GIS93545.1 MAG: cytidylate kinase [Dehalococcoidia bacterium]
MASKVNVITIDGPVAAGKTVVGRELAQTLGFTYLDTGIMYRAVTWLALNKGIAIGDETLLGSLAHDNPIELVEDNSEQVSVAGNILGLELREANVDQNVSIISKAGPVRTELVAQQRKIAAKSKIVMIGRDIGTVVLPDADLKIYLTASPETRAKRRWQEMQDRGETTELMTVLTQTIKRDEIDSGRANSPLKPADGAWHINTDGLSIQQLVKQIVDRTKTL